ncbi:hypothetical protein LRP88_07357 [Fusarium phalaenopsidis]
MIPRAAVVHLAYLVECLGPYLSCTYHVPPVEGLIPEIVRYLAINYIDALFAAIYLQRLLSALQQTPTSLWGCTKHLVFLAALRMADKFVNDGAYARAMPFNMVVGTFHLLPAHLHQCELAFLMTMRWSLNVSMDQLRALDARFQVTPKPWVQVWCQAQAGFHPPILQREDAGLGEDRVDKLTISSQCKEQSMAGRDRMGNLIGNS